MIVQYVVPSQAAVRQSLEKAEKEISEKKQEELSFTKRTPLSRFIHNGMKLHQKP